MTRESITINITAVEAGAIKTIQTLISTIASDFPYVFTDSMDRNRKTALNDLARFNVLIDSKFKTTGDSTC